MKAHGSYEPAPSIFDACGVPADRAFPEFHAAIFLARLDNSTRLVRRGPTTALDFGVNFINDPKFFLARCLDIDDGALDDQQVILAYLFNVVYQLQPACLTRFLHHISQASFGLDENQLRCKM